jgi:hypothetical protein
LTPQSRLGFTKPNKFYNLNLLISILVGSLLAVPLATSSVRRLNEREKGDRCRDPDPWLLDGFQSA